MINNLRNPKAYSAEYLDEMTCWSDNCTDDPKTCSNKWFCICETKPINNNCIGVQND
jgi:hypothetical protein